MFQSWKRRSQNFAFLDTLGYFVTLRPNGFSWLHQIWHTSSQDSSAFSCKILKTSMTYKCHFLARKSQKMLKITKIWFFFGLICYSKTFRMTKFSLNRLVPHINTHVKFQKPGFNSFGNIQF